MRLWNACGLVACVDLLEGTLQRVVAFQCSWCRFIDLPALHPHEHGRLTWDKEITANVELDNSINLNFSLIYVVVLPVSRQDFLGTIEAILRDRPQCPCHQSWRALIVSDHLG